MILPAQRPLGLGLIGCGRIAHAAHLPAIDRIGDCLRLVAIADLDLGRARREAERRGAAAVDDFRVLLDRKDIDAVLIATPEGCHAEQAVAAAAAGKHILCEKPIAPSLAEADAIIAACTANRVRRLVGHSRRFTPRYLEIRALLDDGAIGTPRLLRENERRARASPAHLGQGVTLTNAIHEADILRWFTGQEAHWVYGQEITTLPGSRVPDFVSFTVRFADGAIGSSEISNGVPPGYPAYHQLELYGARGAIRAKDHDLLGLVQFGVGSATFPGSREMFQYNPNAYLRQLTEFVAAIQDPGRPLSIEPSEARAALAIVLACTESSRTGREVNVKSGGP